MTMVRSALWPAILACSLAVAAWPAHAAPVNAKPDAPQAAQPAAPSGGTHLAQATPAPPASTLPGGASSVQETYQDWQVACVQQGATKRCALSQQQVAQQNRQRLLLIELGPLPANKADGVLILPFGLALEAGVTLQVDDGPVGQPLRFRTCLPTGCLVPLNLDTATVTAMRSGTTLKLSATAAEGGAKTPFSISLAGFANAFDRVVVLRK
jgi:invasion protein IalB